MRSIRRLETRLIASSKRWPLGVRRAVADVFAGCASAIERTETTVKSLVSHKVPWWGLRQFFLQTGKHVDEQVTCPYCGKPAALRAIQQLKTYCWTCSYMGQDPRGMVDDNEGST